MWAKAIYVGSRPYDRKEQVNSQTGEVIPALKGRQYLFYCADWYENGDISGLGRTRFETVAEKEVKNYEEQLPAVGGFCTVQIRESFGRDQNSVCKFEEAIE